MVFVGSGVTSGLGVTMRSLFVCGGWTLPVTSGGQIRRWNMLQGLLEAGPTDALVFAQPGAEIFEALYRGCDRIFRADGRYLMPTDRFLRRYQSTIGRGLLVLGRRYPLQYPLHDVATLRREVQTTVGLDRYDVVWLARSDVAVAVGPCCSASTILDGDDFEYVREGLLLWNSPWYGAKFWNYLDLAKLWWWEWSFPRRFTRVVRCSQEDRQRQPARNVAVIPNGTDVPDEPPPRDPRKRLLFVGMLTYPPNAQGLEWFVEAIWPAIRRQMPDAELDIVGKGPPDAITRRHGRDGIVVHGFVEDLGPVYRTASAAIVPLLAGGGTRLKILEAIGRRTPVVSTTLGAFGLDLTEEHGVYRADDPLRFAQRCVELLRSPASAAAAAETGREYVRQRYDWRVIRKQVADLVREVVQERRALGKPRKKTEPVNVSVDASA